MRTAGLPQSQSGRVALALAIAWLVGVQLPTAVVDLPLERKLAPYVRVLLPEAWGFFTKDPTEDQVYIARVVDGRPHLIDSRVQAERQSLFGFSRKPRLRQAERVALAQSVPAERWQRCAPSSTIQQCLDSFEATNVVTEVGSSGVLRRQYCGAFVVVRSSIVPWQWRADEEAAEFRMAAINVKC